VRLDPEWQTSRTPKLRKHTWLDFAFTWSAWRSTKALSLPEAKFDREDTAITLIYSSSEAENKQIATIIEKG
jgi:hypothetical protein